MCTLKQTGSCWCNFSPLSHVVVGHCGGKPQCWWRGGGGGGGGAGAFHTQPCPGSVDPIFKILPLACGSHKLPPGWASTLMPTVCNRSTLFQDKNVCGRASVGWLAVFFTGSQLLQGRVWALCPAKLKLKVHPVRFCFSLFLGRQIKVRASGTTALIRRV